MPGPLLCGVGGNFAAAVGRGLGAGGVQDEGWGVVDRRSGRTTFATREIPGLMAAVRAGKVFQAHGRAVCGVPGKPCAVPGRPCWAGRLPDYRTPAVQTELAAFLVAMGERSYYVCGAWQDYPVEGTWNPVYDLPLGAPLGAAVLGRDGVWRRRFARGTNASFDTRAESGRVEWAAGG